MQLRWDIVASAAALCLLTSAAAAQDVRPTFTLQEAQRLALANYQLIESAREQVEQARLVRRLATSAVLPTVTLSTGGTPNFITGALEFDGRRIDVLPRFDYNIAISVSQPIFAGLREIKARRQADFGITAAARELETTAQDTLLEVTTTYHRLLTARENVEISRRAVAVSEETLRVANALFRAGEAVETAVLRARVANGEAQRELLLVENAEVLARQELAILLGVTDAFEIAPPAPLSPEGESLESLITAALITRAEIQAVDLQRRIAELEVEKRRGQYLPVVRAEGTYLKRKADFPSDQLSSVTINATWPVFEGGRTSAEIATARSQLRQIDERRDLLRRQVEQQVRAAYLNIQTLSASLDIANRQVEFARRNAESTDRAYRVGEATDLDVLESNQVLTRSERQLSITRNTLEVARHALARATGRFAEDMIRANTTGGTR